MSIKFKVFNEHTKQWATEFALAFYEDGSAGFDYVKFPGHLIRCTDFEDCVLCASIEGREFVPVRQLQEKSGLP